METSIITLSKDYKLLAVGRHKCLWYRKGKIYLTDNVEDSRKSLVLDLNTKNMHSIKSFLYNLKIVQRVLRLEPRSCVEDNKGNFCFAYNRSLYIIDGNAKLLNKSDVRSEMRNPLQIIYLSGVPGFKDAFVYGEYGWNDERGYVCILQYDCREWKEVFRFPEKSICHVHALIPDVQNGSVYILTGDNDSECGIWRATDNFEKVEPVLTGKQKYRSCAAFANQNQIIYATDTPIETNYLFSYPHRGEPVPIMELPGSVIYSATIGDTWWFATAVEQDPNLPKILHYISFRKGPGIKDRYTHIYATDKTGSTKEIAKMKKDLLPMWLFQFGNASFVNNYRDTRVFLNPVAVKKYSQKTIQIVSGDAE